MTNLTEQEVCIGSLGQQKVYMNWSDVKDICTNAVSEAYEQIKRENAQLKAEYEKECKRADELEDSYWKEVEKNKKLKDLLKNIREDIVTSELKLTPRGFDLICKTVRKIDEELEK